MAHLSFAHLSYPARAKGQAAPDATGKIHERAAHERPCQPQCGEGRSAQAMANDLAERNRGKASACPLPATSLRMRRAPKAAATPPRKKQRDPVAKNSVEKVISSALEGIARGVDRENRALEPSSRLFETLRAARGPITSEQITFSAPFLATARRFFFLDCTPTASTDPHVQTVRYPAIT